MIMKSIFYSINTTYKAGRLSDFFQVFKHANVFVNSVISNTLAVPLSIDTIARFVSISSVIVDLLTVLISLNLLKLRSAVLRTATSGKLLLEWPQAPYSLASAETRGGGQRRHFAYTFQVADDDVHKALYPFYATRNCSILRQ